MSVALNAVIVPSEDIVAREIKGELIIIPLVAGIGDLEDELFTLNDTAKAIWKQLDGKHTLAEITANLANTYGGDPALIKKDVLGLVTELLRLGMVVALVEL